MSGILAWTGPARAIPPLRVGLLSHRGPNSHGTEVHHSRSGRTAAVLRPARLAVTALSSAGDMPSAYSGEPIAVVLDGRIYNSLELRLELKRLGEEFSAGTDAEVVLRGYRIWGDAVVKRLRGPFAFALWDGRDD
ncbi:MAG: asparagine synthetase B, partial [Candidatus Brocadiae bacterium]|nr:asparagine synthetase B [Candidatus Brocadiia bacterium]